MMSELMIKKLYQLVALKQKFEMNNKHAVDPSIMLLDVLYSEDIWQEYKTIYLSCRHQLYDLRYELGKNRFKFEAIKNGEGYIVKVTV